MTVCVRREKDEGTTHPMYCHGPAEKLGSPNEGNSREAWEGKTKFSVVLTVIPLGKHISFLSKKESKS